jgi:hypothetical protein
MEYGGEYYEMVLVYVDDLFVISHEPFKLFNGIQENSRVRMTTSSYEVYILEES